ncbi:MULTISPECIES: UDP-N-acetylmuramate dehydrogenase [Cyanophyceae]|uniref:UDP-N-acetylmuramate dehydrogenase n=1 Tax=Cyanophyceae TaxID=3028117 RepID=UPI0016865A12|nr:MULTISPECIES: UDP-N-acetylmuramate dehydrogenase [Cyanophyceae]MBD1916646.1 UDP-N-acetylmuramate dehydrogenase [Phormidium sp. FACHB-77]MBD2030003.1 UDP-N-acetylmuramate dehydrogenase [Phormidium sp. FACHB-322]MBD2053214.1 UDP-N-acetylmuramate dehydrogenase [Leptolyngbya sp. FACHB-60]
MNQTLGVAPNFVCLKPQVSLQQLTTFRVGGPAEWLAMPHHQSELEQALDWAIAANLKITPLGAGSNLLISDRGIPGLVLCTRRWRGTEFGETGRVTVAAGEPLPTLAWKAAKRGCRGLEWAVGIPGTVGGAVVMNAGAHGGCTADVLVSASVLDPEIGIVTLTPADLAFQYRTSILQGGRRVVLDTTFQLEPGHDPKVVMANTLAGLNQRRATQPYDMPNCGSVFRNPYPHTAGTLIEKTGLKGYRIGNAQVSERHANFIVNLGGATATDIQHLIRHVQDEVEARWAVRLQTEVRFVGEFPIL